MTLGAAHISIDAGAMYPAHMDLPVQEALRRFRAIKRGQDPNTMTGGMHI